MVTVSVDLTKYKDLGPRTKQVTRRVLELSGLDLTAKLQKNSEIPGKLRVQHGLLKAWAPTKKSDSEYHVRSPARYTAAQNWGSTHTIKPKSKKALHWGGKPGYFSKGHSITIPAKHFVEKSINQITPRIPEYFQIAVNEVMK
jgi:hypothetical protein